MYSVGRVLFNPFQISLKEKGFKVIIAQSPVNEKPLCGMHSYAP